MEYDNVNFDHNRKDITGLQEVILAEPKTVKQLENVIRSSIEKSNSILITRIQENQIDIIKTISKQNQLKSKFDILERTCIISKNDVSIEFKSRMVGIISAGTSDQYAVEEAKISLEYFGIKSSVFTDAGVAGLHRHKEILEKINKNNAIKILIVVAGQDGALFPVISAQTKLPVIAVPTEVGYGLGGKGVTALYSALQSCSPGVGVVNIGNGFGAASLAYKIIKSFESS